MTGKLYIVSMLLFLCVLTACDSPESSPGAAPTRSPFSSSKQSATGADVTRDTLVLLPADHASHPAFTLEWWYLTFVLKAEEDNAPVGLQFTLFRLAGGTVSNWSNQQQWMGHVSLHTKNSHIFKERVARGGVGNAGVEHAPFSAFIDDWAWQSGSQHLFPSILTLPLTEGTAIQLRLSETGPFVKHGENGFSVKSADESLRSYYYSQPFIQASGTIYREGRASHVEGQGWFDHEWTSELANDKALGWDWFSLHLNNGNKLMAFRMHTKDDAPFVTGTLISANGQVSRLQHDDLTLSPETFSQVAGRQISTGWLIEVPSKGIAITTRPFKANQFNSGLVPYYEGMIYGEGSHTATGFMELTGY